MIVGNDISNNNPEPNYDLYINNANFVIVKATEGTGFIDPTLARNKAEARRVKLPLGFYHFARPDLGNTPEDEAYFFLKQLGDIKEGELLALDFEVSYSDPVNWCKVFLDTIYAEIGIKPLIYLNKTQVKTYNWSVIVNSGYGLWLACYDNNIQTGQWKECAIQQWTDKESVPGIASPVDGDYFFGTIEQFKAYGFHGSSPSASVSPSASASPSQPPVDCETKLSELAMIINSSWNWFGVNGWYNKVKQLKKILNA